MSLFTFSFRPLFAAAIAVLFTTLPAGAQAPSRERQEPVAPWSEGKTDTISREEASNSAGVTGTVTDEKGEPITNAVVVASEGSIQKAGALTDLDGRYAIRPLEPGRYTITFSYQGSKVVISDVLVASGQLTWVNERIKTVPVTEWSMPIRRICRPMLNAAHPTQKVFTNEQIERLPTR